MSTCNRCDQLDYDTRMLTKENIRLGRENSGLRGRLFAQEAAKTSLAKQLETMTAELEELRA